MTQFLCLLFSLIFITSIHFKSFGSETRTSIEKQTKECVVLLHGLNRTSKSMRKMKRRLRKEGFKVVNFTYPSRKMKIQNLAKTVIPKALSKCPEEEKVNFVTHSLGGIILRAYLKNNSIENLKHVVMLGPPNGGSEAVDKLKNIPGFYFINGKAGLQLGTQTADLPSALGATDLQVGIVAGSKSINLILSQLIPGTDDGKVSIEKTKLEGMTDHIVLPVAHPFLMTNRRSISQTVYFLRNGNFRKEQ